MRNLTTNEADAVAGGPWIVIDPGFKSKDDGSESSTQPEADTASDSSK